MPDALARLGTVVRDAARGCVVVLILASFLLGVVWVVAACIPEAPYPDAAARARRFGFGLGCLAFSLVVSVLCFARVGGKPDA